MKSEEAQVKEEPRWVACDKCDGLGLAYCETCKAFADACTCKKEHDDCIWCGGGCYRWTGKAN